MVCVWTQVRGVRLYLPKEDGNSSRGLYSIVNMIQRCGTQRLRMLPGKLSRVTQHLFKRGSSVPAPQCGNCYIILLTDTIQTLCLWMEAGRSKPGPDSLYLYIYIFIQCQKGHPQWLQWTEHKHSQAGATNTVYACWWRVCWIPTTGKLRNIAVRGIILSKHHPFFFTWISPSLP